jgi:phosphoribosylglycinamide formyltransferase 2
MKTIMLLGSGELGKEFVISAKRMGYYVIACDSYVDAPAMQVSDDSLVFNMLDSDTLSRVIREHQPDIIVPEIEAIATEVLYDYEANGVQVVPSARAVNLTMNRDKIRDRAAELGLRTAKFVYAESEDELIAAWEAIPSKKSVIKPVMSSSGKGQSVVDSESDIDTLLQLKTAWYYACENMRGDRERVIIEEFIDFDYEITLLTIKQKNGPTLFCDPIGHVQERGDYQYSWQPFIPDNVEYTNSIIAQAQAMAEIITDDLGGAGLFGVEFFIKGDEVIFSELSPRPHDTGMVTLRSQRYSEFDLHARAVLGLPINATDLNCNGGASAVVLYQDDGEHAPKYEGIEDAMNIEGIDVRIFGKPFVRKYRRMGVVLGDTLESAREAASLIRVI